MEGMININFIQDVLGILVDEIEDQDLLGKISLRLKGIEQEHRNAK